MTGEDYIFLANKLRKEQEPFEVSAPKLRKKTNAILAVTTMALLTVIVTGEAIKARRNAK